MIDLHSHVLPGIDDGARDLEMAVEMCRAAAAAGTEALIATPHQRRASWWNCDRQQLAQLRRQLQAALGPSPRIYSGGEVRVDAHLLSDLAEMTSDSPEGPLGLADSRYLLLEFDAEGTPDEAAEVVHELSVAGWIPVLAHPEHIQWLGSEIEVMAHLVNLGALSQVTAMSVTGDFGRRAQTYSHRLIERGLAHFIASDTHDLRRRPPTLQAAWKAVAQQWGELVANDLLVKNPRAVLQNLPLNATRGAESTTPSLRRSSS